MEIKVGGDFNFDSACTSPYVSAPSSPQMFGSYFSAPTSPTRATFNWEENAGVPNRKDTTDNIITDDAYFAFDFSGQLDRPSLTADELFDGGKIKPLNPLPIQQTRGDNSEEDRNDQRGRERTQYSSSSSRRHKGTRSLSPLRVSDMLFDQEDNEETSVSTTSSSTWNTKWKLMKNLLLFRSASEGRGANKDPLKNFLLLKKIHNEDVKNSSLVSSMRRKGPVSAHELHYKVNRAVSEDMKKKTFLPYKRGLLGCLGFTPGVHHVSTRIGSSILTRQ